MEWETESELEFLQKSFEEDHAAGKCSTWDQYQLFNASEVAELRRLRIKHNQAFAQSSKKKLEILLEAEKSGVLFMK